MKINNLQTLELINKILIIYQTSANDLPKTWFDDLNNSLFDYGFYSDSIYDNFIPVAKVHLFYEYLNDKFNIDFQFDFEEVGDLLIYLKQIKRQIKRQIKIKDLIEK